MGYVLELTLLGLPSMGNSHKAHWAIAGAERKKWRTLCAKLALFKQPTKPLEKFLITCTRHSPTEPDFENLAYGFKSVIDGLKDAKVIKDDSPKYGERKYLWAKAKRGEGKITIKVEEI